jgi:hypothetical protein
MAPGIYDATIYQRDTWNMVMTFSNSGVALNLTGYTAAMEIRDENDVLLASPTLTFTVPRTTGILTASLSSTDTEILPVGTAKYDLFLTDGTTDLVKRCYLVGDVVISPKVTQA